MWLMLKSETSEYGRLPFMVQVDFIHQWKNLTENTKDSKEEGVLHLDSLCLKSAMSVYLVAQAYHLSNSGG